MSNESESRSEATKLRLWNILKHQDVDKMELKNLLDRLEIDSKEDALKLLKTKKLANPGVVGIAAFAITATLFQFHNFGWVHKGPVLCLGFVLGGCVQILAGLLEFGTGNNFGFAVFSTFGAFWVTLVLIIVVKDYTRYTINDQDMGFFMLCFLIFTLIIFAASLHHSRIMAAVFLTLVLGIGLLMVYHFCPDWPSLKLGGAIMLLINSLLAFYLMASVLLEDVYKYKVLPLGPPMTESFQRASPRFQRTNAEVA